MYEKNTKNYMLYVRKYHVNIDLSRGCILRHLVHVLYQILIKALITYFKKAITILILNFMLISDIYTFMTSCRADYISADKLKI